MTRYIPLFPPFKPSNLRFPTGPSSPASPLSPLSPPPEKAGSPIVSPSGDYPSQPSPVPPSPSPWIWFCHICHKHYPLGATRRCLFDGHIICFCPSEKVNRRTGKIKRRRPCFTEFDYSGWTAWNEWRRRNFPSRASKHERRHGNCCQHCDYPSQCADANHGAPTTQESEPLVHHNPQPTGPAPPVVNHPTSPPVRTGPYTTFEQLLGLPTPEIPPTSPAAVSKRTGTTLDRAITGAETRSAQSATQPSPDQEESHARRQPKRTTPTQTHETTTPPAAATKPAGSKARTTPTRTTTASGSKQQIRRKPVALRKIPSPPSAAAPEDFQSFKARMDQIHGASGADKLSSTRPLPSPIRSSPPPTAEPAVARTTRTPEPAALRRGSSGRQTRASKAGPAAAAAAAAETNAKPEEKKKKKKKKKQASRGDGV